jgi:hypothetical protein
MMLLRRVSEHVKAQNWTAVGLDFVIVVVGVFIGIQVSNWNATRIELGQERVALERLLSEAENAVAYSTRFIESREEENLRREAMIAFFTDPERHPMDQADAANTLAAMSHYPPMTPSKTVYDELSASGTLRGIRSQVVRDRISLYIAELNSHDTRLDYFRQSSGATLYAELAPFMVATYDPAADDRRTVSARWEAIRNDEKAAFLTIDALRNQLAFQRFRISVLEHAQAMCDAVAKELGDQCIPELAASRGAGTVPDEGHYLGQKPPGLRPELFAQGIVSTDAVELNSVFTPDGREFFFTRLIEGPGESEGYPGRTRPILFHMVYENGAWSVPRPLRLFPDAPHAWAADMSVSPDGRRLYFMGPHPVDAASERSDLNLWVSHRVDGAWSVAEPLPAPVNSEANEIYSSVVADGSLYFTSNRPGASATGASGLFRAQALDDGGFGEPVNAGIEPERGVGDTFVAPDESYVIFTGRRDDGFGSGDLWVAFRDSDGGWGEPLNLGPDINSDILEYCPMVTPDGKYLFFSRRRSDPPDGGWPNVVEGDVYWVDASVIERLRPAETGAGDRP